MPIAPYFEGVANKQKTGREINSLPVLMKIRMAMFPVIRAYSLFITP